MMGGGGLENLFRPGLSIIELSSCFVYTISNIYMFSLHVSSTFSVVIVEGSFRGSPGQG